MTYFWLTTGILILIAYLIGSIASAILICKFMRLPDPRNQGSKNPGATNVLRIGGKKAAIFTLLGDTLKGLLPVFCVHHLLHANILASSLVMFAAFIGHIYPIFFNFKGGKGVATAFGGIIALNYPTGIALLLTWLTVAFLFRFSSLAAIFSAIIAPCYIFYFLNTPYATLVTLCMSSILIYRHRTNIQNLINGQEKKLY